MIELAGLIVFWGVLLAVALHWFAGPRDLCPPAICEDPDYSTAAMLNAAGVPPFYIVEKRK